MRFVTINRCVFVTINVHEIPFAGLLIAQLAASELLRAARFGWLAPPTAAAAARAAAAELGTAATLSTELQRRTAWVGGVTNHEDAFIVVYRRLLLLWAIGPAVPGEGGARAEVAAALGAAAEKLARLCFPRPILSDFCLLRVVRPFFALSRVCTSSVIVLMAETSHTFVSNAQQRAIPLHPQLARLLALAEGALAGGGGAAGAGAAAGGDVDAIEAEARRVLTLLSLDEY